MPAVIAAMAPSFVARFQRFPARITGKKDEAARPKAWATTSATRPGGWRPSHAARPAAESAASRAAQSSARSLMRG